jgi:hypothetical protein
MADQEDQVVAENYGEPVYRRLSDDGRIYCEHCYDIEGYVYYDSGATWCPNCAHNKDWTDSDQYNADYAEDRRLRKEGLKEEIGGFTGMTVYKVETPKGEYASKRIGYARNGMVFSGSGPLKNHLRSRGKGHSNRDCDVVEYELVEKNRCSVEEYDEHDGFPPSD